MLSWSLTLSQAMEMVTRAFYSRADLDLILSSPASARKAFAVRICAIAISTTSVAVPLAAPFINALAYSGGPRWLGAYGVAVAMGLAASALAVALTVALFRTIGPRRTRLVAQIIAAVVGAAFVIGVQALAILSSDTLSRIAALQSEAIERSRAGRRTARSGGRRAPSWATCLRLSASSSCSLAMLGAAVAAFSGRFAEHAIAAAGVSAAAIRQRRRSDAFRPATRVGRAAAQGMDAFAARPVARLADADAGALSAAAGAAPLAQLRRRRRRAGGARARVRDGGGTARRRTRLARRIGRGRAGPRGVGPDPAAETSCAPRSRRCSAASRWCCRRWSWCWRSPRRCNALVTAAGILVAAGSATLIQLWFRTQAKRSHFRRRQTSSRIATFAEAFSSISWAAAAGLAATGTWLALFPCAVAFGILAGAKMISPR